MVRYSCILAFILLFFQPSEGFGNNFWKIRELLTKDTKSNGNYVNLMNSSEHYIEQQLDHFNPQDKAAYRQRYFVNDAYFTKRNGPVFLFIGGESPVTIERVMHGFHVKAAEKLGALIFAVEHRFYGQSMNDDSLRLENLKYLSSQQALADLAHFHQVMTETYKLDKSNKWICFGGSYPGALSAWFRLKYPHLVVGAVSSSSPVRALVDFQGYNDVVAKSLETEIVGGSIECSRNVQKAFREVDKMLDRQEFEKLGRDFKLCSPLTQNMYDMYTFASETADIFMGTVQYNNIASRSAINIEKVCNFMTSSDDTYENLGKLYRHFLEVTHQPCTDISWDNFMAVIRNDTVVKPVHLGIERQWTYQTCAQFGYYQACEEHTHCILSKYLTLAPSLEICQSVFGINPNSVYNNVDFTNSFYGSDNPHGSNILFVNGLIDPWHALSVLRNLTDNENALVIEGTAHCADMHPDSVDDPENLTEARKIIMKQLEIWLGIESHKKEIKLPLTFRHESKKKAYTRL